MEEMRIVLEAKKSGGKSSGKVLDDSVGDRIAKSLEKSLGRIGMGKSSGGDTGGAMVAGAAMGAGMAAMTGGISMIIDLIKDFPIVTATMKILKGIITLLLLPLVPILKPILLLLGGMARALAPYMKLIADTIEKILGPTIDKAILAFVDFVANNAQKVAEALGLLFNILLMLPMKLLVANFDSIVKLLGWFTENANVLFEILIQALTWAGEFLTENWNKIYDALVTVTGWFSTKWDVIKEALITIGDWFAVKWNVIWKIITDVAEWFGTKWDVIKVALDFVGTWISEKWNKVKDVLTTFVDSVTPLIEKINSLLSMLGMGNKSHGGNGLNSTSANSANGQGYSYSGGHLSYGGQQITDGVISPSGRVISTDPNDFLIATKNPRGLGGGGTINLTINNPTISKESDIKALVKQIEQSLYKSQRRYNSYAVPM